jgi:hypothetical protein
MTAIVAATEFCRDFATYQIHAQREPIEVRDDGKVAGYYISADEYQRVARILLASRHPYDPSELPPYLVDAIRNTRMGPEHDSLNSLMDDE